jgi:ketosteroid isomerase-like protein
MSRGDTAALGAMLAADVVYTHSTGDKQDKAAFLRALGSGELRYKRIAPTERVVRFLSSEAAVVVGRSNMEVESQGQPRSFAIRYLAVYGRTGNDWQLVAWQSTLLPD